MEPLAMHLSPLPRHPWVPEAWLSYLGDSLAEPGEDGGPQRARPLPRPAGVHLHSLLAQLCQRLGALRPPPLQTQCLSAS